MIYRSPTPDLDLPDISLTAFVLERMAKFGDETALIDGVTREELSYAQTRRAIQAVAGALVERSLEPGEVTAIIAPGIIWYPVALHGIAWAGGVFTTLNPMSTPDDAEKLLGLTGATRVFVALQCLESLRPVFERLGMKEIIVFGEAEGCTPFASLMTAAPLLEERQRDLENDILALPYSSGTSGLPKAVMLTSRNLTAATCQMNATGIVQERETLLCMLPLFHIYGLTVFMGGALSNGNRIVVLPAFDFEQFLSLVQEYKVNVAPVVAPIVLQLAKHPLVDHFDLSSLRVVTTGASPISPDVAKLAMQRLKTPIINGWGMTETATTGAGSEIDDPLESIGSVGRLASNMQMRIIALGGSEDVAEGEAGEIWLRGPNIMKGYYRNEAATAETFTDDGWLRTGDVARLDANGRLHILDRAKEFIKFKGFQISPAELEAILTSHPGVADAGVIPSPDAESGEVPKAFVVKRGEVSASELMDFVAERVSPYKKLREIEFVDAIPKTPAGKILRRVLIAREREVRVTAAAAANRLEDRIIVERHGAVLAICLDRPRKMNGFDKDMFVALGRALAMLEDDVSLRAGLLHANGMVFTSGLDMVSAGPLAARGELRMPDDAVDLTGIQPGARRRTKPLIAAVHGKCLNLGMELVAACDFAVAEAGTIFAQKEVSRGLFPFGSATVNLAPKIGLGNALRYMLTADEFDAEAAHRMGLVQEVAPTDTHFDVALALAQRVAANAPLGVTATIASVRIAREQGDKVALELLPAEVVRLTATEDFKEGVRAFIEKRDPVFAGC